MSLLLRTVTAAIFLTAGTVQASACWVPQYVIHAASPSGAAKEGATNLKVRSVRGLVINVEGKISVPAIELLVVEGSRDIVKGSLIRLVIPDGSSACGLLANESAISAEGVIEGFIFDRLQAVNHYYVSRFHSGRNLALIAARAPEGEWKNVKWSLNHD